MFYMVVRIFFNPQKNSAVEIFNVSDYDSVEACAMAAEARFHNIITADLQNPDVVYQMTYIMNNNGGFVEKPVVFDRRTMAQSAQTEE